MSENDTVYIKYNPYTVETEFKIDGKPISKECKLNNVKNERLQYWLEEKSNWNGIVEELTKLLNTNEINIKFKGRKIDYDDLILMLKKSKKKNKKLKIRATYIPGKEDKDILNKIDKLYKEIENSPIKEIKVEDIKKSYEEVKSSKFKISVLATMSSGKSTLINSLIGYELLPSKNMACTATIARITSNNKAKEFTAECRDSNENIVYKRKSVTSEDIKKFNEDEKVTFIDMEGKIPGISSEKLNLLLYDTPGPNNARNEKHGELTESIIRDKDKGVVLYVINATQFGINDDNKLLSMISQQMKRGGKQSKDRFIFVINKCDELDPEKGESIDDLLNEVKKYLNNYGIEEPNLFPVSAQIAKLIRMSRNGKEFTKKEKGELKCKVGYFNDLEGYHFEKRSSLSESCKLNIENKLKKTKENSDIYTEALIHTGIPCIEESINEYLEKYAYPIKIKDAIKEFNEVIEEKSMKLNLAEKLADSEEEYDKVRKQIKNAEKKLESLSMAKYIKSEIDKLNIDGEEFKKIEKDITIELGKLTRKYDGKVKIEKSEADILLKEFGNGIKKLENELKVKLEYTINELFIQKAESLVNEYNNYLINLQDEIEINNFNFEKIKGISTLDIDKILNESERENLKKEDITEEKLIYNEGKKWWNPLTWFEDDYIKVVVKVGEREVVDFNVIVQDSIGAMEKNAARNIKNAKNNYEEQIMTLKNSFKCKIKKLNGLIEKNIKELDNETKNKKELEEKVNSQKDEKNWVDNIICNIKRIMDI